MAPHIPRLGFPIERLEDRTTPAVAITPHVLPSDPSVGSQWGLAATDTPQGWNVATGTGQTILAVIDTGVDLSHPDLAGNLWTNPGEIAGNGRDDDGNGYVDDVHGYDFANGDADPSDPRGHGTHVAGIAGAVGNNGAGTTGVAWKTRIMALKIFDDAGRGSSAAGARAIDYAVANGAKVINASWGGAGSDPNLAAAIARARAAGVIVVASAGNDGQNNDTSSAYPANYASTSDNVVAVAATTSAGRLAGWSNYGPGSVAVAAPGEGVLSTAAGGGTTTKSGTSMAAPFVAGALTVLWDQHPTWTYQQVLAKLRASVDPLPALAGKVATGGQINLAKLLDAPTSPPPVPPVVPPPQPPVSPPTTPAVRWTGAGPRVVAGQFLGTVAGTFDRVRVTFDKKMNAPTFAPDDVAVYGPGGRVIVTGLSVVAGTENTVFDVTFARQSAAGSYSVSVGPDVWDVTAQRMDQNGNGVNNEAADRYTLTASLGATAAAGSVGRVNGVSSGTAVADFHTTRVTFNVSADRPVSKVTLTVDLAHARTSDLQLRLTAPDGRRVVLFNRTAGANLSGVTFDTTAFAGVLARGEWVLEIFDVVKGTSGTLRSAGLLFG